MKLKVEGGAQHDHQAPTDWGLVKQQILSRLDLQAEYTMLGLRFSGPAKADGWRPCHAIDRDDTNPSAAVHTRSGVYRDSGGSGATLGFLDFALRFGQEKFGRWLDVLKHYAAKAGVELGGIQAGKGGRIKEATYFYRNADGSVRYAVFRYRNPNGSKTFSQHPPDGKGGWVYGPGCMDGIEPIPYRLPEIMAADRFETIWIVEGEKDADRLAELGLVATTNHQGSGSTDRTWPRFLDVFKGRCAVVLPDNDSNGRAHCTKVANYLVSVADMVKVVELKGLPPKGDVSDWLDAGGTVDGLSELAVHAPAWKEGCTLEEPTPPELQIATVADLRRFVSATAWVWPYWIPNSVLTLLAAEAGTGKTRFLFDLHRRAIHGLPWPDGSPMEVDPDAKILWIAADGQFPEMMQLCDDFKVPDTLVYLNAHPSDPVDGTSLQSTEELKMLERRIAQLKPWLVVIDTITNTSDYKSQDSSDAKRQYKPLQEMAIRQRTPIICVTHTNLSGKVLGRRATEKCRVVMQLSQPNPDGEEHRRKLWVQKSSALKPPALGVTMGTTGNDYDTSPPEPVTLKVFAGTPAPALEKAVDFLKSSINGHPKRVSELRRMAEEAGIDAKTLYRAKDKLGIVESVVDDRKWWDFAPEGKAS